MGWVVIATGCLSATCGHRQSAEMRPEPGLEFIAVTPDTVREVTVSSKRLKLFAYRWTAGGRFQVVLGQPGTPPEQCLSGDGFDRLLTVLARVPVRAEHRRSGHELGREWVDVRLRDASVLEPIDMTIALPGPSGEPVLLAFRDRHYVVDMDAQTLGTMTSGCAALGGGK